MFVFIWPEKKSNDRVTQNRFCVDELSDESISCSQAMCLWTSTFVVKPMLLISTHWLCCGVAILWVCAPRPSETQKATFSRAGALHLSLLSSILCTGAKLRFSLVRTGGGRSRSESGKLKILRATVSKVRLWKGCDVHCGAWGTFPCVWAKQRTAASPLSWSAARWR